ncbi:MAG: PQQ-binding-like beta-propeller repeat protein [Gemmataceae bacterium]|nr:PQQ-binding-like beta-propeller repeat protein [Gemmataceae bacterium]
MIRRACMLVASVLLVEPIASAQPPAQPLPAGALLQLGSTRLRHPYRTSPSTVVLYSPDGKTLASHSDDHTIRLWNPATGKVVHQLTNPKGGVSAFAFSSDSKIIASGGAGFIRLWDVTTGKQSREWEAHAKEITSLAFSPDSKQIVSGSSDRSVRMWDAGEGKELRVFADQLDPVVSVAFSADGKRVAAGGRRSVVHVWDAATGNEICQLKGDAGRLFGIAFSPDSQTLAMGSKTIVRLWDLTTRKEIRTFGQAIGDDVTSYNNDEALAFSADGATLATGGKSIRLWEVASGKRIRSFGEPGKRVSAVSFSHDGKVLATSGGDQVISLWDPATGQEARPSQGHRDALLAVACGPGGKLLATGSSDQTICIWDLTTGKLVRQWSGDCGSITALAFSADGKLVASGGSRGEVCVWDVKDGSEIQRFKGHQNAVRTVVFSPTGKLLSSVGEPGQLRLYDLGRLRELGEFPQQPANTAVAFSPDGKLLAAGGADGNIRLYNVLTGEPMQPPAMEDTGDIINKRLAQVPGRQAPRGAIRLLTFSPSGQRLNFWTETGVFGLWDASTNKALRQFDGIRANGFLAAFAPDGKTLATRDRDNHVVLVEIATGNERRQLRGHLNLDVVSMVAFSGDGRTLVSVSDDTTALVWDVTGQLRDGQLPKLRLTAKELDKLWGELAQEDGTRAFQGLWNLVTGAEDAMPFLQERLKPVAVDPKHLDELIVDLDSNQFQVREKARQELEELAELAEGALKKTLTNMPALEVRRRIEALLAKVEKERFALSPHRLRVMRVIEALEHIGTPEARKLLEAIGDAPAELRLTDEVKYEAKASLKRLALKP